MTGVIGGKKTSQGRKLVRKKVKEFTRYEGERCFGTVYDKQGMDLWREVEYPRGT